MQIELTKEEAAFLVGLLGRQPIESGASMLWAKMRNQFEQQSQPAIAPVEEQTPKAKAK